MGFAQFFIFRISRLTEISAIDIQIARSFWINMSRRRFHRLTLPIWVPSWKTQRPLNDFESKNVTLSIRFLIE